MIKNICSKIYIFLNLLGLNLFKTLSTLKGLPSFIDDLIKFKKQAFNQTDFKIIYLNLQLEDRQKSSGITTGHYFHQDLHIARKIFLKNPSIHLDIGSRIDGFVAHVASFREIEILDIRPNSSEIPNMKFTQADIMDKNLKLSDYCDSISSLHAVEHFGLGRYGDSIDFNGHKKGLDNIYKILKRGGIFYFSVPIGKQRVEFNAHRVFDIKYLLKYFENKYFVNEFSLVTDQGNFIQNIKLDEKKINNNCSCNYGCGIFELIKI